MRLIDFQMRDLQAILFFGDDADLARGAQRHEKIAAAIDGNVAGGLLESFDVGNFGQLVQVFGAAVAKADGVAAGGAAAFKLHDLQIELGDVGEQVVNVGGTAHDLLV